tara:strand:+ start:386 stop:820 length:435 start_codon:yes stop_codon:yes gene_type:complete
MNNLEYIEDIRDQILAEEQVQLALPEGFIVPEIVLLEEENEQALAWAYYDKIQVKVWCVADTEQLWKTMRHEIAHVIQWQQGIQTDHSYGFRTFLQKLYNNDAMFYYNGSPILSEAAKAFAKRRSPYITDRQKAILENILHGDR